MTKKWASQPSEFSEQQNLIVSTEQSFVRFSLKVFLSALSSKSIHNK
ncbi:MAG: hypothetical protein F6K10_30000 [Moorea sp. SIO2B7]|nr:hypothetical protein [Moorena sp. SIO2B7]